MIQKNALFLFCVLLLVGCSSPTGMTISPAATLPSAPSHVVTVAADSITEGSTTLTGQTVPTTQPYPTQTPLPAVMDAKSTQTVSPDGQWTAIFHPQNVSIEVVSAKGLPPVVYQAGKMANSIYPAEWIVPGGWSPDSHSLLFWLGPRSGSAHADGLPLWVLNIQTGQAMQLAEATLVNPDYQSWSPDGSALVFTKGGYRSAQVGKWLSLYQVETGEIVGLIPQDTLVPGAVTWSPEGNQVAVAAVDAGMTGREYADFMGWDNPAIAGRRIYLVDPKTGAFHRLTQSASYEDTPRWSQNGKRLFFIQADGSQARLVAMTIENGSIEALQGCEAPMPSIAGYYGQVDWSNVYAACADLENEDTLSR